MPEGYKNSGDKSSGDKIEIRNAASPNHVQRVDKAKYLAMRDALMGVLPGHPPGITPAQAKEALLPSLSQDQFPGGDKAGWWLKAVQLDLESQGVIERGPKAPVRLYKTGR